MRHDLAGLMLLQLLALANNNIRDLGVAAFGPHLVGLASLQHLELSDNGVGADGVTRTASDTRTLCEPYHVRFASPFLKM